MLVIELELLTGRFAATSHNDRSSAEWPPHPARLFSALVAALHDKAPTDADEREALLWLEGQPPPALDVDLDYAVGRRRVLDVYVPVNDVSLIGDLDSDLRAAQAALDSLRLVGDSKGAGRDIQKASKAVENASRKLSRRLAGQQAIDPNPPSSALKTAAALLPDRRTRQARTFPVALPARSTLAFLWNESPSTGTGAALGRLCARVTRLGHSSSLVRCAITEEPRTPTLVPGPEGNYVLRVVGPGQLARLENAYVRHQAVQPRVLPALPQRYAEHSRHGETARTVPRSVFSDEWIVFERVGGARPLSSRGPDLARALRNALLEQNGNDAPLPATLSGHAPDGRPSSEPHLAFVPLPFVGREFADGSLQGCAIVLPAHLPAGDRERLFRLIAAWERSRSRDDVLVLAGDTLPPVHVRRTDLGAKASLAPRTWCAEAERFITATPIALDRHPGNLRSNVGGTATRAAIEAQASVADACERIGLPRPISVEISVSPLLHGAQPVHAFVPWPRRPGRHARARVHAEIRFAERVRGPLVLGAGRFFGLGLCLPIPEEKRR